MVNSTRSFPAVGAVLWGVDAALVTDVFRSGGSSKPNVEFLRFHDLGIDKSGRIPENELDAHIVRPGQGISLFLERMAPKGLTVVDTTKWQEVNKKMRQKIFWWSIEQKHPIPSGLELIYDGDPEGHCTLTVTRDMTVGAFLRLVSLISFTQTNIDLAIISV